MTISPAARVRRAAAVLALATIALAGCGTTSAPSIGGDSEAFPSDSGAPAVDSPAGGGDSAARPGSVVDAAESAVITTGWASVRSDNPQAAAEE
nr:hypothetical protein [Actinomycetales bacterium]